MLPGERTERRGVLFAEEADQKGPWDFFLTHAQASGGDQTKTLCLLLRQRGFRVWYDMEQWDKSEAAMERGVQNSQNLLIFLSDGYMGRPYCQKELRWGQQYGLRFIGVKETDERHGKADFEQEKRLAPADLVHVLSDVDFDPYQRDADYTATMLDKIQRKMKPYDLELHDSPGQELRDPFGNPASKIEK